MPLLAPRQGFRGPLTDPLDLMQLADQLAAGDGPVALDAERASGFRYSSRAYLVQLHRPDVGTVLLDPVELGDLEVLAAPLRRVEWVLHAASQDLACLEDAGLTPSRLFDTELGARLAGFERVGLGPLTAELLGVELAKGHGADDWSKRPLRPALLNYAALDVELLLELRDAVQQRLIELDRLDWAHQEFAHLVAHPPRPAQRAEPWRRTSGLHAIRQPRQLALVRALWHARDQIAERRDLAPHRILRDQSIVALAQAEPSAFDQALRRALGPRGASSINPLTRAAGEARALPADQLPSQHAAADPVPPPRTWARKNPAAHARWTAAKAALATLAEQLSMPPENLLSPDLARRILWDATPSTDVPAGLVGGGARAWQVELTAPLLTAALRAQPEKAHEAS